MRPSRPSPFVKVTRDDGNDAARQELEHEATLRIHVALEGQIEPSLPGGPEDLAERQRQQEEAQQRLGEAVEGTLTDAAGMGADTGRQQVDEMQPEHGFADWHLVNQAAADWARRWAGQLLVDLNENTQAMVRAQIADWIESGEPLQVLKDQLAAGPFSDTRASRIAVTEVTRSYAEGNMIAWRESGVVRQREWRTANDELVEEICRQLDGARAALGEPFAGPDGPIANPPAHVNCRCWCVGVVED